MKRQKRQLVSSFLVLTILASIVGYAFAEEAQTKQKTDPYIAMVSLSDNGENAPSVQSDTSDVSSDNSSETQKSKDKSKTARYIIKYTSTGGEEKVDKKIKSKVKEGKEVKGKKGDKKHKTELIILNTPISPEEFATELRSMDIDDAIEYIQPDFKLNPDSVSLQVEEVAPNEKEAESSQANTGESVENKDDTSADNDKSSETGNNNNDSTTEADQPQQPGQSTNETDTKQDDSSTSKGESSADNNTEDKTANDNQTEEQPGEDPSVMASPVIVAVIDTGADVSHDSIRDFVWTNEDNINGWNFVQENGEIYNSKNALSYAHGTHISGIIAQVAKNNNIPLELVNCRVFENGKAYTSDVIEAIEFAEEKGAKIINMSFGGTQYNPALYDVMSSTDAVFVTAAGNNRMNLDEKPIYPACFDLPNKISVTSTNTDGGFSYFSNYSVSKVDITARGRDVVSALPGNKSGKYSGTSMSAAYVSAVTMAVASLNMDFDAAQIKAQVLNTADRFSNLQDKVQNGRNINLQNALDNKVVTDITEINPADDFDVTSYDPTPSKELELFSQKKAIETSVGYQHTLILMEDGTVWAFGNGQDGQLGNGTTQVVDSANPCQVIGLTDVVKIEAGAYFSMAVKRDGTLWVWGRNNNYELGIGDSTNRTIPIQVTGLYGVKSIGGGWRHALALDENNVVYGWGCNYAGELCDEIWYPEMPYPIQLAQGSNIGEVGAGQRYSIIYDKDSYSMKMCGKNQDGQLKDGTLTDSILWVSGTPELSVDQFAAGTSHVITQYGHIEVNTWGKNNAGQLGVTNAGQSIPTPQSVSGNFGWMVGIAAGNAHSLIFNSEGKLFGSGDESKGQLLSDSNGSRSTFTQIDGIQNVTAIDAAADNSVAIKEDGTVWIWGSNLCNQISTNTISKFTTAVKVGDVNNMNDSSKTYSLTWPYRYNGNLSEESGKIQDCFKVEIPEAGVYCASIDKRDAIMSITVDVGSTGNINSSYDISGGKKMYQLAAGKYTITISGETIGNYTFRLVHCANIGDVQQISVNYDKVILLSKSGKVWEWGDRLSTQLEIKDIVYEVRPVTFTDLVPEQVVGLNNISQVDNRYAVSKDGSLYTWGYKNSNPKLVSGISGVKSVTDKMLSSTLVLKNDGTVWKLNADGNFSTTSNPVQINGLNNVKKIVSNYDACIALKNDGTVWTFGRGVCLGLGVNGESQTPIQITTLSEIDDIDIGNNHVIALKSDGSVFTWGNSKDVNESTGAGNTTAPVQVTSINNVTQIAAGWNYNLALSDNKVYSWGLNSNGQLGINSQKIIDTPTLITNLPNISSVFADCQSSYVIDSSGDVLAFGCNQKGQLGNQLTEDSTNIVLLANQFSNNIATRAKSINLTTKNVLGWSNSDSTSLYYECTPTNACELKFTGTNINVEISKKYTNEILTYANNISEKTLSCNFDGSSTYIIKITGSTEQLFYFSASKDVSNSVILKSVESGRGYMVFVTANNQSSLTGTYTLTYDAAIFDIVDLCGMIPGNQASTGSITGSDILILQNTPGVIKFTKNKTIPNGMVWSGLINAIKLKAKLTTDTSVAVTKG